MKKVNGNQLLQELRDQMCERLREMARELAGLEFPRFHTIADCEQVYREMIELSGSFSGLSNEIAQWVLTITLHEERMRSREKEARERTEQGHVEDLEYL